MDFFTMKDLGELCTIQQVVKMVGVTRQAVHLAIKKGKLRVKYLGHHPYPYREDAELWTKNRIARGEARRSSSD